MMRGKERRMYILDSVAHWLEGKEDGITWQAEERLQCVMFYLAHAQQQMIGMINDGNLESDMEKEICNNFLALLTSALGMLTDHREMLNTEELRLILKKAATACIVE